MFAKSDLLGLKNAVEWPYLLQNLGFQKINIRTRRCCCLLHGGDNQSAFSWNRDFFHCFSCLRWGDAIELVRVIKRLDFAESVKYLADLFGFRIQSISRYTEKKINGEREIPQHIVDRLLNQDFEKIQIEEKIKNCPLLDYPKHKLEMIIFSDASTDRTDEIIKNLHKLG